MREQIDEQHPRLISSTNRRERINVPEVVYEKGGLRGAETIIIRIAHDPAVAAKLAPDRVVGLMNRGSVTATSPSSASSNKLASS